MQLTITIPDEHALGITAALARENAQLTAPDRFADEAAMVQSKVIAMARGWTALYGSAEQRAADAIAIKDAEMRDQNARHLAALDAIDSLRARAALNAESGESVSPATALLELDRLEGVLRG